MADTAIEIGVYLYTPTHVGAGGSGGAIDLPIAREVHTGHPLLPSSALKGVARAFVEGRTGGRSASAVAKQLFGPPPPQRDAIPKMQVESDNPLHPGKLVFTDGHLLAFPVRSLSAPFYWVTCPLAIHRWRRARSIHGLEAPPPPPNPDTPTATFPGTGSLVLEDHLVDTVGFGATGSAALKAVAGAWSTLCPPEDGVAVELGNRLICLPDVDFAHLVRRCTTIAARVQLTTAKTTDAHDDEKGNLWYEESLPPECLFSFVVKQSERGDNELEVFRSHLGEAPPLQIGGNETIGQGLCSWREGASR